MTPRSTSEGGDSYITSEGPCDGAPVGRFVGFPGEVDLQLAPSCYTGRPPLSLPPGSTPVAPEPVGHYLLDMCQVLLEQRQALDRPGCRQQALAVHGAEGPE